jgi:hypothetical protein
MTQESSNPFQDYRSSYYIKTIRKTPILSLGIIPIMPDIIMVNISMKARMIS